MKYRRLLLVDDHAEVLKRIGARLAYEDDILVAGEARTGVDAIRLVEEVDPDVILIDPVMQDGMGMEILKRIREMFPLISIVVLTSIVDAALNVELKKLGINDVLEKSVDSDALVEMVRAVNSQSIT
ncbi:MAG: response regulator transcription factor [Anaerolineae bacterium]|nr:response regulator transcription factor [Anaerolineae bacterium]